MADSSKKRKCKNCKKGLLLQVPTTFYDKEFKPITLEHINVEGEGPLTFERERDLQDYCKKHKLSSGALL